jgi:CheY-like chemotaxis protein
LILYIEDNRSNIDLIEQIISSQRADIELITDMYGETAVELAINHHPDLILLDLNLPDIPGNVVLERLKSEEKTKNIPVIVISADAMPKQLDKLLNAGAKHYLTKPLDIPEFLRIIEEFLPDQNR